MKKKLFTLTIIISWITAVVNPTMTLAASPSILITNDPDNPVLMTKPIPEKIDSFIKQFLQNNKINSLDDYVKWQAAHLHYIKDEPSDNWQEPQETIKRGGGDCEDLSFLHAAVLKYFGFEPRVLAQGIAKEAHVFCMFKRNGTLSVFDNINYVETDLTNFDQVNDYLKQNYHNDYLLELTLNPKSIKPLYENTVQLSRISPSISHL